MENLPKDPAILFSDMNIERGLLEAKLRENGWEYNSCANKFW